MSMILIFPPFSTSLFSPPAALPSLKAFLESRGNDILTEDLNIEFIHHVIRHWDSFYIDLKSKLEIKIEESKEKTIKSYLAKILYIYCPVIKNGLIRKNRSDYHLAESLIHLLIEVVNCYYFEDRQKEGKLFISDPRELTLMIENLSSDPFLLDFLLQKGDFKNKKLVGLSFLAESQLVYGVAFVNILRRKFQHLKFVAGGAYITEIIKDQTARKFLLEHFDFLCAHEGETALLEIFQSLGSASKIEHPNVITKQTGSIDKFHEESINQLPPPDFAGLNLNLYLSNDLFLPVYTSKGCSWGRCTFCSMPFGYKEKEVSRGVNDIVNLIKTTNINHVQLVDENVTPKRLQDIASLIISEGIQIRWFTQIRFDNDLDERTLGLMKKSGCYLIEFGLESGSKEILKKIRKGISLPMVKQIIRRCADLDLEVIINCMVGFPEETMEHAEETVDFLDQILTENPGIRISCNTQIVKIYRSSKFINMKNLTYKIYPFSTTVDWKNPAWVPDFIKKFEHHILLNGKSSGSEKPSTDSAGQAKNQEEYFVELARSCEYIGKVSFDFLKNPGAESIGNYMAILGTSRKPEIYRLNEPMDVIVGTLSKGRIKLIELKKYFLDHYRDFEKKEALSSLSQGIIYLNQLGVLSIC